MNSLVNECLDSINNLDNIQMHATQNIFESMIDSYEKAVQILEYYNGEDLSMFSLFKESTILLEGGNSFGNGVAHESYNDGSTPQTQPAENNTATESPEPGTTRTNSNGTTTATIEKNQPNNEEKPLWEFNPRKDKSDGSGKENIILSILLFIPRLIIACVTFLARGIARIFGGGKQKAAQQAEANIARQFETLKAQGADTSEIEAQLQQAAEENRQQVAAAQQQQTTSGVGAGYKVPQAGKFVLPFTIRASIGQIKNGQSTGTDQDKVFSNEIRESNIGKGNNGFVGVYVPMDPNQYLSMLSTFDKVIVKLNTWYAKLTGNSNGDMSKESTGDFLISETKQISDEIIAHNNAFDKLYENVQTREKTPFTSNLIEMTDFWTYGSAIEQAVQSISQNMSYIQSTITKLDKNYKSRGKAAGTYVNNNDVKTFMKDIKPESYDLFIKHIKDITTGLKHSNNVIVNLTNSYTNIWVGYQNTLSFIQQQLALISKNKTKGFVTDGNGSLAHAKQDPNFVQYHTANPEMHAPKSLKQVKESFEEQPMDSQTFIEQVMNIAKQMDDSVYENGFNQDDNIIPVAY